MIHVGVSRATHPRMQEAWPAGRDAAFEPLAFLAGFFGCVEVDASAHVVPRPEHVARWARALAARDACRMLLRLPNDLVRPSRDARSRGADLDAFRAALAPVLKRERLGAAIARLDPAVLFGPSELRVLADLARRLGGAPLVLEAPHSSWFDVRARDAIRGAGWSLAHPPVVHDLSRGLPPSTGPIAFVRLTCPGPTPVPPPLIGAVARRAEALAGRHGSVFVVAEAAPGAHVHPALALSAAVELQYVLAGQTPVAAWPALVDAYPHLAPLARIAAERPPSPPPP